MIPPGNLGVFRPIGVKLVWIMTLNTPRGAISAL
jgi:hypothetical protein